MYGHTHPDTHGCEELLESRVRWDGRGRVKWIGVGMREHMNIMFLCVNTL